MKNSKDFCKKYTRAQFYVKGNVCYVRTLENVMLCSQEGTEVKARGDSAKKRRVHQGITD